MIRVYRGLHIADPWPAAYLEEYDALVMADLHLGIEGVLAEEGVYLPRRVSKATLDLVIGAIEDIRPRRVIFLGDVKHSFSLLRTAEWVELKNLFNYLSERRLEVDVVRGNHDNYLGVLLSRYGIPLHEDALVIGPYTLAHGHKDYSLERLTEVTLLGHEHPSVAIRDDAGIYHKFKAFLFGEIGGGKHLMILPPVCELAPGSTINLMSREELLSPLLKKIDLSHFTPYLIVPGRAVERFPRLYELPAL